MLLLLLLLLEHWIVFGGFGLREMKEWKWRVAFVLWRSDREFMFFCLTLLKWKWISVSEEDNVTNQLQLIHAVLRGRQSQP
jgi:hypothetical protein